MTFAPQLVDDVTRVRTARRLRGRSERGVRAFAGSVMPVLEGALERAVNLAAAMDSRGYGRTGAVSPALRRSAAGLLLGGLLGIALGVYGLLDDGTAGSFALPLLVIGAAAGATGLALSGRRSIRTRYRPDPWALPEWLVTLAGVVPAGVLVAVSVTDPASLVGPTSPPAWPALPLVPALAVLAAALAGVVTPPPPGSQVVRELPAAGRTKAEVAA